MGTGREIHREAVRAGAVAAEGTGAVKELNVGYRAVRVTGGGLEAYACRGNEDGTLDRVGKGDDRGRVRRRRRGAEVRKAAAAAPAQRGEFESQVDIIGNEMQHQLLTGEVKHRIASAGGFPGGVTQRRVIGEGSHRPFRVGRA